jgi:hypothetical protein
MEIAVEDLELDFTINEFKGSHHSRLIKTYAQISKTFR